MSAKKQYCLLSFLYFGIFIAQQGVQKQFALEDFQVYYTAAHRLVHHLPLYRVVADGHYVFKYSPLCAALFIPFLAFQAHSAAFLYLCGVALFVSYSFSKIKPQCTGGSWAMIYLIFAKHIQKEFALGQVNLLLLGLLILFSFFVISKPKASGVFLFVSLVFKPFGLVFALYLALKKQFEPLKIVLGAFLLGNGLVGLIFYPNFSRYVFDLKQWGAEMVAEISAKKDLLSMENHTLLSGVFKWVAFGNEWIALLIAGVILIFLIAKIWQRPTYEACLLTIAWIPLAMCTSNNFYVLSLPLFVLVISQFKGFSIAHKVLIVGACLLMGGNQYELFGPAGVNLIDSFSPYPMAVLIQFYVYFYAKNRAYP